jgi:hypothetical protein
MRTQVFFLALPTNITLGEIIDSGKQSKPLLAVKDCQK